MKPRFWRGTLAYDGTRYAGFQRQAAGIPTIQAALEDAIASITQQPITVRAAGRTDAGVHASGQVIGFECQWKHPVAALWRAVNVKLPSDIALKDLQEVEAGFHPRFDAIKRRYVYRFYTAPVRDPLRERFSWWTGFRPLDLNAMQAAANQMLGTHDFATFGQPPQGKITIRRLYVASCDTIEEDTHRFTFEANAFLQHQVRSMMGTLVEVGHGDMTVDAFAAALAAADRSRAGKTAPPQGLILVHVSYRGENPLENLE